MDVIKLLTAMPNIGTHIAKLLVEAGIESPQQLRMLGSEQAFIWVRAVDPDACINVLYGLEGAVQGIRWHDLDVVRKMQLREFFRQVTHGGI